VISSSQRPRYTQEPNIHSHSGIRTRDPSNRVGAILRLRQHSHRDSPSLYLYIFVCFPVCCRSTSVSVYHHMRCPRLTLVFYDVITHSQHRASNTVPVGYGVFSNLPVHNQVPYKTHVRCYCGVRGSRGTTLQPGRSRVRFPMGSLRFFIDIIPPAAVWPWDRLNL
jgi:hypothetical protein